MDNFKDYILESTQTVKVKDVPKHIQTKAFKDMLAQKRANDDLVLVLHITDQGHEAELLNTANAHDKEMLKHRLRGGAKLVEGVIKEAVKYWEVVAEPKDKSQESLCVAIAQKNFGRAGYRDLLPNGARKVAMRWNKKWCFENGEYLLRKNKIKYTKI